MNTMDAKIEIIEVDDHCTGSQLERWASQPVASTLRELRRIHKAADGLPKLLFLPGDDRLKLGAKGDRYHRYNSSGRETKVYSL